jgi:phosphoglycerate kinase
LKKNWSCHHGAQNVELKSINSVCFRGKRVLLRADFNVPKVGGVVTDDTRLLSVIPTIRKILSDGGYPVILSHYGDPKGKPDKSLSLEFLRSPLEESLASPVAFVADYMGEEAVSRINKIGKNQTVLCENTRFHQGEKENRREFAEKLSFLGDVFVNDAFSVSHRAHASVVGDNFLRVLAWYDNEWGFSHRMCDVGAAMGRFL